MSFWFLMFLGFIGTCALLDVIQTIVERRVRNQHRIREEKIQAYAQEVNDMINEMFAEQERLRIRRQQQTHRRYTIQVRRTMTVEGADRLLASYGGYRAAVKKTHPDCGGSSQAFRQVQEAKEILDRHKKGLI